jgi:hypothetical protein
VVLLTHGPHAQSSFAGNLLIVRSDPGDDLDPGLVDRPEPLILLLRILVLDGADEVVAPAFLVDLARVPLDDDLVRVASGSPCG